jgi:peptidoglycan/LPS O-acetylase OafA/YrhL
MIQNLACFKDIHTSRSLSGQSYVGLDGLRGLAALLVLAEHTGILPTLYGRVGVWLFFALSGFLLTKPFIAGSVSLPSYYIRRLFRILPMYIIYVLAAFIFYDVGREWLFEHLTFIHPREHLWTIKQELVFYLFLPLIIWQVSVIKSEYRAGLLYGLAALAGLFLTKDIVALTSPGDAPVRFHIGAFLAGMAAAYMPSRHFTGLLWLLMLCATAFVSLTMIQQGVNLAGQYSWLFGIVFSFIIISECHRSSRVFSFVPLRAIGVVGYSFYLWHFLVRDVLISLGLPESGVLLALATLALSYAISCLSYSYIEKPFLRRARMW